MMKHCVYKGAIACSGLLLLNAHAEPTQHGMQTGRGVDCLMVENASILRRGLHAEGEFGMANLGHQIYPGPNMVLAIRAWEDSGHIDSRHFLKATVEFSPAVLVVGKRKTFKVLRSYYSEGSAGHVAGGAYSWALNPFESVRISRSWWRVDVTLDATIAVTNVADGTSEQRKILRSCPVKGRYVWQLDEWEGKVGTDWNSFSPNQGIDPFIVPRLPTKPSKEEGRNSRPTIK